MTPEQKNKSWAVTQRLKRDKNKLSFQQFRTIKGQIKSGDIEGAARGLDRLQAERRERR